MPKAVQASSSDTGAEAVNLINRSGLRDQDADRLDEHSTNPAHMWRSAEGETAGWVEFDLGAVQSLGAVCIWNYNDAWYTDRGVGKADISVWAQEAGWRKVHDDLALEKAQGSDDYDEPMFVKLEGVKAQKIRFDDLTGFGDTDCVGLSEVQFFAPRGPQAVQPEPPDGTDAAGVGDLELTWSAGEGAKAHNIYVGTDPNDLKLLGRIEQAGARLSSLMNNSEYFWRVDEVQADGPVVAGKVWSFTTGRLAGWWKLDEAEGTKAADNSGNGHDGVIHGDPKWLPADGKVGGALQFDGVDDYVDTGWAGALPVWTMSAWIKSPAAPTAPVASGPVHCEKNFQISWDHGSDSCRGAAGVCVGGTWHAAGFGELKADTWYHLAATYDGETLKAYKDGVLIMDNTDPSGPADSESATLKFGRHATTEVYFAGAVDEVSIFTYALGDDQVKALHSGRAPSALAAEVSSTGPRLAQAVSASAVQPISTPARGSPAGPAAAQPQRSWGMNFVAVVLILAIVGVIAAVSVLGRYKTQLSE